MSVLKGAARRSRLGSCRTGVGALAALAVEKGQDAPAAGVFAKKMPAETSPVAVKAHRITAGKCRELYAFLPLIFGEEVEGFLKGKIGKGRE
jgi:hypothetical protein